MKQLVSNYNLIGSEKKYGNLCVRVIQKRNSEVKGLKRFYMELRQVVDTEKDL